MTQHTIKTQEITTLRLDLGVLMRRRIHELLRELLEEELTAALACEPYERSRERNGYRNGRETRRITTELGPMEIEVPRGRLFSDDGSTVEFRTRLLEPYARRTKRVDETILGVYLAGANTRRIKQALKASFGKENLSKSAISRVVGRLQDLFETWDTRDFTEENYVVVFLDAINLKVRLARKVVSAPVLAVLGVRPDGRKEVIALRLAVSEATQCWGDLIEDLKRRGMPDPELVVIDGHLGLGKAVAAWPHAKIQRCVVHKLRNLIGHCPKHAHKELRHDFWEIMNCDSKAVAEAKYTDFVAKWNRLCPPVVRSLKEAGAAHLLTFYELPGPLWRSIRTTNGLENLNREFRRRTKTQGSFSTEGAAVTLLYGLLAFGQIKLRRIDGHHTLWEVCSPQQARKVA